jgi:hypothetical protein
MVATDNSCFLLADFIKSSLLKLLSQMNRNLVGSNYGRSYIKIAHFIPIRWQTWLPQKILVSDWPISNNFLLWNCLAKWSELWWEAPIEGQTVLSFLKAEWKVNDIGSVVGSDLWASIFSEQSTNICRITTCNERCINRVHLTFSLYANCQNRPCGKEFNTTAFVNLLICNVNVYIILWRNLNIISMKLFPQWLTSLSTSITLKYCVIKRISHYSIDAPGQRFKVSVAYWSPTVMSVPQKA